MWVGNKSIYMSSWAQAGVGFSSRKGSTLKFKTLSINSWIELLSNICCLQFQSHLTSILLVAPDHLSLKNYRF